MSKEYKEDNSVEQLDFDPSEKPDPFDGLSVEKPEFLSTILGVITSPIEYFQNMSKNDDDGLLHSYLFLSFIISLSAAITFVPMLKWQSIPIIILLVIFAIILSIVTGPLLFGLWNSIGSKESLCTAYKCVCFSYAIFPVLAILFHFPNAFTYTTAEALYTVLFILSILWIHFLFAVITSKVHRIKPVQTLVATVLVAFFTIPFMSVFF
ncbi:YIP1 family protein [Chitinispirillales bacterium ANBcel5]|uniref:YIP1 family protein n=1 Tax=Cellulosispirillum alkaliphilum TaxID=3039283 RepID=UPI002A508DBF|nr:YIP1 family protein [Chitinispirillales bacterium ANBcel5]